MTGFPVVWLDAHPLCWDQAQVDGVLTALGGRHVVGFDALPVEERGAVVMIPARYYKDRVDWLRNQLGNLEWAVVFLTSDEESTFPVGMLERDCPSVRVWTMTPRPGVHEPGGRFLGHGPTPDTAAMVGACSKPGGDRPLDWVFAGQVNHERRHECVDALSELAGGRLVATPGFTQGLPRSEYVELLTEAKVAPCPSGPATPDSFRVWEALEAGCLPVADGTCPRHPTAGYWNLLLGQDPPFPVVGDWAELPGLLEPLLAGWPANSNRAQAWWQQYRRDLARRIRQDIADVSGQPVAPGKTTVLISTSPIPAHPSTEMIEATVASVRHHLPDAEIVLMCDGVRDGQEHRRADYEEFLRRVLWLSAHEWGNTVPLVADDHQHQANMTRRALTLVDTPLVLFVEHDTPLVTDEPIDWQACATPILGDELDVVRFHYEAHIPEPHRHLMLDDTPRDVAGCPVIRTRQFSARPHLASTDWYRLALADHFPESCRTFIEDKMHSVCQVERWGRNRLAIYAPGPNLKRSLNLDGRQDDPKADCVFG